jgi:hypothetical protein
MAISTLSSKNQTTLRVEFVRALKLAPGARLKQWVEGNRIILEPIEDVSTAFGALKARRKFRSVKEETQAMEAAIGKEVARNEDV